MSKFSRRRQQGISGDVAGVIRRALSKGEISSVFGLEGPLRAALRAHLCLRGWGWIDAHRASVDVVRGALMLLGAERPSWNEGQADYAISEAILIERTRCKHCGNTLPEGQRKYCHRGCASVDHQRLAVRRRASDYEHSERAITLAKEAS